MSEAGEGSQTPTGVKEGNFYNRKETEFQEIVSRTSNFWTKSLKDLHIQFHLQVTITGGAGGKFLLLVIRSLISSTMTSFAAVNNSYFPSLLPEGLNSEVLPSSPKSPSLPFFRGYKNRLKQWKKQNLAIPGLGAFTSQQNEMRQRK